MAILMVDSQHVLYDLILIVLVGLLHPLHSLGTPEVFEQEGYFEALAGQSPVDLS